MAAAELRRAHGAQPCRKLRTKSSSACAPDGALRTPRFATDTRPRLALHCTRTAARHYLLRAHRCRQACGDDVALLDQTPCHRACQPGRCNHAPRSVAMPGYLARVAQASPSRLHIGSVAPLAPCALHQHLVLLCACALRRHELRERCELTPASVQAARARFPELVHPPGFGAHRLTVWRSFDDVPPARAWSVLSDWRAPYISASGTGACRGRHRAGCAARSRALASSGRFHRQRATWIRLAACDKHAVLPPQRPKRRRARRARATGGRLDARDGAQLSSHGALSIAAR